MNPIHKKALEVATRFKQAEADLILVLQEVELARVFIKQGYTSLFSYCVQALGLSESVAANFITVARKAREVPILQAAIQMGTLSVSKARKITPVLTLGNQKECQEKWQDEWVEKAKILPTRKLEEEVARVVPREATPERFKFVSEERLELKLGVSKKLQERLERVRDLESQRTGKAVSFEEALEAMAEIYLASKDPIKKAERVMTRKAETSADDADACVTVTWPDPRDRDPRTPDSRTPDSLATIPAIQRHQVQLRDGGHCTQIGAHGERCENRRWLDIHHIRPRSEGGGNELENLTTLCSAHHRMEHSRS